MIIRIHSRIGICIKHTLCNFIVLTNIHKLKKAKAWEQPLENLSTATKGPSKPCPSSSLKRCQKEIPISVRESPPPNMASNFIKLATLTPTQAAAVTRPLALAPP